MRGAFGNSAETEEVWERIGLVIAVLELEGVGISLTVCGRVCMSLPV